MEENKDTEKIEKKKTCPLILVVVIASVCIVISFLVTGFIISKNKKPLDLNQKKLEVEDKSVDHEKLSVEEVEESKIEELKEIEKLGETEPEENSMEAEIQEENSTSKKMDNIDVTNRYIHPVTGRKMTQMEENSFKQGYLLPKDINSRVFLFLDDYVIENVEEYRPGVIKFNIGKVKNRRGEDLLSKPVIFDFEYHNLLESIGEDETYEFNEFTVKIKDLEEFNSIGYLIRNK